MNQTPFLTLLAALALIATAPPILAADAPYADKAAAIVKPMRFMDDDVTQRAIELTVDYLAKLDDLAAQRKTALEIAGAATEEAPEVNHQTAEAWKTYRRLAVSVRNDYVSALSGLMAPGRVDRVKDGLTGDWYHLELQRFDRLAPDLTYPERAHIVGLLVEMRENAMLETDIDLQRQWAHKYRGIINNYIASRGYDFHALAATYKAKYE